MSYFSRVRFFGSRALIGWYISSVTKYVCDTDSEQVPWGKDEKNFEKRVKSMWNCWKGSKLTNLFVIFFFFCFIFLVFLFLSYQRQWRIGVNNQKKEKNKLKASQLFWNKSFCLEMTKEEIFSFFLVLAKNLLLKQLESFCFHKNVF